MSKKTLITIIVIIFVIVLGVVAYYVITRKKEETQGSEALPKDTGEALPPEDNNITPERWNKIVKEEPKLASRLLRKWYNNLKRLKRTFGTKEAGENFVKWLEQELSEALRTQNYNRNLAYWQRDKVDTPEASIVRSFVISQSKSSGVSKEDIERLSDAFNDRDLTLLPVVDELFSEVECASYYKSPSTNFDIDL